MGSVDVAAHDGAVTCVNFPLGSFLGPVGAVSLFFEIIFSRGSVLNVILVNPTLLGCILQTVSVFRGILSDYRTHPPEFCGNLAVKS